MKTFIKRTLQDFFYLSAILGFAVSLHFISRRMERDLEWTETTICGEYRTPVVIIRRRLPSGPSRLLGVRNPPKLLLIHGLSASKSVMMQMGIEMAQSGAECYLMDLPGHGASVERFTWEASRRAVQEISHWILPAPEKNAPGFPAMDFFLIGHSLGGGLAIEAAREDAGVTGVIALSPMSVPVARNSPQHLLILYGENDFPFVRRSAPFLFEETTGISIYPANDLRIWENPGRTHRLVALERAEHSGDLFLPQAYCEIKGWINRTARNSALDSDGKAYPAAGVVLNGLQCMAALAAWFPLFSLAGTALLGLYTWFTKSSRTSRNAHDSFRRPATGFQIYGAYALFSFLTLLMLKWFDPWDSLQLMGGGFLSGFLSITGIALFLWKIPPVDALSFSRINIVCCLTGFLLLVLYPLALISRYFAFLEMTPLRVWRLPIITLSTFPFFLWDEWVFRNFLGREGKWQLVLHFLSTRLILAISLMLGFFLLNNAQFLILLLLPGLAFLSLLGWIGSGWVFSRTQSCAASALFSSLLTGWIFSTFFVQI